MSTPNFQDNDFFGSYAGMGSPFDFNQHSLGYEAEGAFSPVAPSGTVSPSDIMFDNSVPPSGAFTDLSTPSFGSPGTFSQNPSPFIGFTDLDVADDLARFPLFPEDGSAVNSFDAEFGFAGLAEPKKEEFQKPALPQSPAPMPVVANASPALPQSPAPKPVAANASPVSATGTSNHSTGSGITRARKELSPVEYNANDPIAAKRARNTEAARKSRLRKQLRQAAADSEINDLKDQLAAKDRIIEKLKAQLKAQQTYQ